MKCIRNIRIGIKLMIGFIIVALIAGIVGVVGITKIRRIDGNYSNLYTNYGMSIGNIGSASISYQRLKINLYKMMLEKNTANNQDSIDRIKSYDKSIQEDLSSFEKSIENDSTRKEFSDLKTMLNKYQSIEDKVTNLINSGKQEEAFAVMTEDSAQKLSDDINDSVDRLFNSKMSIGNDKSAEYSIEVGNTVTTMTIIIVIAMVLAVGLGVIIAKAINNPIKELMYVADAISDGKLTVEIINDSKDEIGILSETMRKMKNKLRESMEYISVASDQVTVGSKQIADSTVALSQGATEQASAVEELTSSVEEISSQINLNAQNAKKANEIADNTKTNATKRNGEMKLMLNAMEEINASSNNISKIIKVIDEIAFQTNILALNAAVEAARAGQYGKGFTVVAEEVRNLAARSAKAAEETTDIIEESLVKIQDGTKIANQTAEALETIVHDVEEVATLINDIADASEEQATGMSQISQGVIQISQVVQNNSATAEESAAASEELAGQAEVLKEQVSMFDLGKKVDNQNYNINSVSYSNDDLYKYNAKKNLNLDTKVQANSIKSSNASKPKRIILSDDEFGKY